jgi:hypothetical protein
MGVFVLVLSDVVFEWFVRRWESGGAIWAFLVAT